VGDGGVNVRYQPNANFFGTDTFTYNVQEQNGGTATGTVTVTVNPKNDPPTASADAFDVAQNVTLFSLDVLKNDSSSPDTGEQLTITQVTAATAGGTVVISDDKTRVQYTPLADFLGADTFQYTIDDGNGSTAQATVTVTVREYVPRAIGGDVMFDNTALTSAANPVGGIDVVLTGHDSYGVALNKIVQTDADGAYSFLSLAPGQYELAKPAQPFLLADSTVLTVTSALTDVDSTNNDFAVSGRKAAFISIADFLVTAPGQSAMAPTDAILVSTRVDNETLDDGEDAKVQDWYSLEAGWVGFKSVDIHLTENPDTVHVVAYKNDGARLHRDLSFDDTQHVQFLGQDGDAYLLRVIGSSTALNMDESECCTPAVPDQTAPSGYTIAANDSQVNATEAASTSFTFGGAEVGATYNYTVSSSGGGTAVTGSGTVSSATQQVTGINVSTLSNGTLTYSVILTDAAGNAGAATTAVATLDRTAPSGYTITANDSSVNATEASSTSFTFAGAEVGATFSYSVSSSGGGTAVTGSGTVSSATQQVTGINVSTLSNGTLTYSVILTDAAGNAGAVATAATTLDKTAPSGYTITADDSSVDATEAASTSFTFAGAEVGAAFSYSVSSNGGGTAVTGSGTVASATQQVTGINVSTLSNGTLTYSVILTDPAGNVGGAATAATTLNTSAGGEGEAVTAADQRSLAVDAVMAQFGNAGTAPQEEAEDGTSMEDYALAVDGFMADAALVA
jgi:hypothetical protein